MAASIFRLAILACVATFFVAAHAQDSNVGLEYFVKSGTWYETLRLTMEKVNSSAPKATPFAVITPYTTDDSRGFSNIFEINIDVSGWTNMWLSIDIDPAVAKPWDPKPRDPWYWGVWGNPRVEDSQGKMIANTLAGYCAAFDAYSISCNVDLHGKNDRYDVRIGDKVYPHGLTFAGNGVWNIELTSAMKSSMKRFKASVGAWSVKLHPKMRFKVTQQADHQTWIRAMWDRTLHNFVNQLDDMTFERSTGLWDTYWSSITDLAKKYAAVTPTWNNYRSAATSAASSATNAQSLHRVRGFLYAGSRIPDLLSFMTEINESNRKINWFTSLDEKETEIRNMMSAYGNAYTDSKAHLAHIANLRTLLAAASAKATANMDPWAALQAAQDFRKGAEEFTFMFPPWLYGNMEPKAIRTVRVSTVAQYKTAISNLQKGDHIIIKNGFYPGMGDMFPTEWPKTSSTAGIQDPTYPVVIQAETPGGVVVSDCGLKVLFSKNVIFRGLVLRACPAAEMHIEKLTRNVRFTDMTVTGTADHMYIGKESSSVRVDHNFFSSGYQAVIRRFIVDHGGRLIGRNQLDHNYMGQRRKATDNGAEMVQNYAPISYYNNFMMRYVGEGGEVMKCASWGCFLVNNTLSPLQQPVAFPGRFYSHGVSEGNYYLGHNVRAGADVDKQIRNNYLENGQYAPGPAAWPVAMWNEVNTSSNTFVNARLSPQDEDYDYRHNLWMNFENNIFINSTLKRQAGFEHIWVGGDNSWLGATVPSVIPKGLFDSNGIAYYRDEYSIVRPRVPNSRGFQRQDPPFTQFDSRVGPTYVPASVRINRHLVAEYTFTKDRFVSGTASNTVHSDYGSFVWHLGIKNANKANADLRGPGVSEQPNDYSFDNSAAAGMGGKGGVVSGSCTGVNNVNAFSVVGWFKGVAKLGNGAVLVSSASPSSASTFAWEIRGYGTAGDLEVAIRQGSATNTFRTSGGAFAETNEWVFFAVNFNPNRGTKTLTISKGTKKTKVVEVYSATPSTTALPTAANNLLTIGARSDGSKAFDGWIDNVRIFYSENGPDRTDFVANDAADLTIQNELQYLHWYDLGLYTAWNPLDERKPTRASADAFAVLRWPLTSNYRDALGDWSHDGTTVGTVSVATETSRGIKAAKFTGNGYLWHREHIDLDLRGYTTRSIAFAFKPDNKERRQVLFEEGHSGVGYNVYIDSSRIYFGVWDQATNISPHKTFLSTALPTTSTGWIHIVVTINSATTTVPNVVSNGFKAYVNGQGATARLYAHDDFGFALGGIRGSTRFHDTNSATSTSFQFLGFIQDLRLFNRLATTSDINSLSSSWNAANNIGGEAPVPGSNTGGSPPTDDSGHPGGDVPLDDHESAPDAPPQDEFVEEPIESAPDAPPQDEFVEEPIESAPDAPPQAELVEEPIGQSVPEESDEQISSAATIMLNFGSIIAACIVAIVLF